MLLAVVAHRDVGVVAVEDRIVVVVVVVVEVVVVVVVVGVGCRWGEPVQTFCKLDRSVVSAAS